MRGQPFEDVGVDPTWTRLEDQIGWYETRSVGALRTYRRLKIVQLVIASLIPLLAGFQGSLSAALPAAFGLLPVISIGALGIAIVVIEGVQHLNQHLQLAITCRSTCEALEQEKFLFLADAGPYADIEDRRALLAERVEALVANDQCRWIAGCERGRARVRPSMA